MIIKGSSSELKLGLIFDLYFRFREYGFLREVLLRLIRLKAQDIEHATRYLMMLCVKYIDEVDMNLSISKNISQIERYIRVLDLINSDSDRIGLIEMYTILDKIFKKVKILQFEKQFKTKPRSGSYGCRESIYVQKLDFDKPEFNLSENEEDSWEFEPPTKKLSIILQDRENEMDLFEHEEPKSKGINVLLSILLDKLI